jgi:hypothetical protein
VVSGWVILAGFAAVALAGLVRVPAPVAAALVVLSVGGLTLRHPANGLSALVLLTPFLLGEHKTPYFWLEPCLVVLVLVGVVAHRRVGRVRLAPVHLMAAAGFVAAAVLALPLDLRDLLEDLWLLRSLRRTKP